MILHDFDPVLIDFGFIQIRWYSISYILGIVLGWVYAKKIIKNITIKHNFLAIKQKEFDDLIFYLILGIIIGGRLGYVIIYNAEYYLKNLEEILMIWRGGMSFHGGLLGVIVTTLLYSKKKQLNFFQLTDILACCTPIGLFFGRIANFINGELYGKTSDLPWAVIFPSGENIPRHPSQIYEALLEGVLLFLIINFLALKKGLILRKASISILFLILYSILRIIGEFFREPDSQLGYVFNYFSMGTILSFITILSALFIVFFKK